MTQRTCTFDGCERPFYARDFCNAHYLQLRSGKPMRPIRPKYGPVCTFPDCGKPHTSLGLCDGHFAQQNLGKPLTPLRKRYPPTQCVGDGCEKRATRFPDGVPVCDKHATRLKVSGTLGTPTHDYYAALRGQLESDVKGGRSREGCWEWQGAYHHTGYGIISTQKVTHMSLEHDGRPRPEAPNNLALHSCDNPPCYNPAHLRWGSNMDNVTDAIKRGRRPGTR